ncbi:MAG: hypothetical protein E7411_09105 [Ruminococcaceae bacterium]|nr:hypothetical protein [Oscillospiraceae bacterium]
MKSKYIIFVILILSLCMSSFAYANETYLSEWSIEIKNQAGETDCFKQGDLIEVSVKNSNTIENALDSVVHFTYNTGLIEYVKEEDFKNVKEVFDVELNAPYIFSDGAVGVANTENTGTFTAAFVSDEGINFNGGQVIFKVYFKVLESGVSGVCPLNFRWIKKGVYASYIAENSDENKNFNINFKDLYVNVEGEELSEIATSLPSTESFVPEVFPTNENPENVNLNGQHLSLTTPYFVAFSKLVITNSPLEKAGVIVSKTDSDLSTDSKNSTLIDAINIGSDNCFGFLVYGNSLTEGTYYIRAYATYKDGNTIYGKVVPIEIKGDE